MNVGGIFVTPRQVESADQASSELVHIVPGWKRLNSITDILGLDDLLVSNRHSCQPYLGGFSSNIQYQERARAGKCDIQGVHR